MRTHIQIKGNDILLNKVKVATLSEKESIESLEFKRIIDDMRLFECEMWSEYATIDDEMFKRISDDD